MNWKIILAGVVALIGVFWLGRITAPEPQVIEREVIVQDTTEINRLEQEVQQWRDIAQNERDTVEVYIPVPDYEEQPDGTKVYNLAHSDRNLTANIGLTVEGVLEQSKFSYVLKRELVTERTITVTQNRTLTRTELRVVERSEPTFSHSLEAGYKIDLDMMQTPYVQYRPEINIFGFDLVGTAHFSKNPYASVGIKLNF